MKCLKCNNGTIKFYENLIEKNDEQHIQTHGVCPNCGVITDKDGNSIDDKEPKELNIDDLSRWANGGPSDTKVGL